MRKDSQRNPQNVALYIKIGRSRHSVAFCYKIRLKNIMTILGEVFITEIVHPSTYSAAKQLHFSRSSWFSCLLSIHYWDFLNSSTGMAFNDHFNSNLSTKQLCLLIIHVLHLALWKDYHNTNVVRLSEKLCAQKVACKIAKCILLAEKNINNT